MADADGWASTTWDGNRRAQIRRALALSVRERLAALEHMAEVANRLADLRIQRNTPPERQTAPTAPAPDADPGETA